MNGYMLKVNHATDSKLIIAESINEVNQLFKATGLSVSDCSFEAYCLYTNRPKRLMNKASIKKMTK